jgi:hypothetical protein
MYRLLISKTNFKYFQKGTGFAQTLFLLLLGISFRSHGQVDTVRIMTYNVLNYGDACQGSPTIMTSYLKTIVGFCAPDLMGLVKLQAIKLTTTDVNGISPVGFADTIIKYALNVNFPGRYAHCPLTNVSLSGEMTVLFYNQHKFTCKDVSTLYTNVTDFDLYTLYYNDPYLGSTHDTTFLYVVLNHTISGNSSTGRDQQIAGTIAALQNRFYHWPNLIDMGDFNVHSSYEPGYQEEVAPPDTNFRFFDPPFYPDATLTYPLNWDSNPVTATAYLTTSTRQSPSLPNTCGTSGGAKSWYDHILLSPWIVNNSNYIQYLRDSYKTIGNDGHRLSISVNDSTTNGSNTSAPSPVVNALFEFSNKYPVMLSLLVYPNTTGHSLPDPDLFTGIATEQINESSIRIVNPVLNREIHFWAQSSSEDQKTVCSWYDLSGRQLLKDEFMIGEGETTRSVALKSGCYILHIHLSARDFFFKTIIQ